MLKSIKTIEHGEVFFVEQTTPIVDPTKVAYDMYAPTNAFLGTIKVDLTKPLPTAKDVDKAINAHFGSLPF